VRCLNDGAVPAPSVDKRVFADGRQPLWQRSSIGRIITDPTYKGEAIAWRWKSAGNRKVTRRDPSEHIKLPRHLTTAIVTPKVWAKANEKLKSNSGEQTRNSKNEYLLRGIIFCRCGKRMYSEPGKGIRYYRCSSRQSVAGSCGARSVRADKCEEW